MLKEIRSEILKEKVITFHKGLNVVLGDEKATNSIGKSNLLMIIDFVLGGSSFIEHNKDVVDELGHHDYQFYFIFNDEKYFFRRGTYSPDIVYKCSDKYKEINPIPIEEYTSFLKACYKISSNHISFRSFVGTFSRVWGKDNLNVNKPLHIVQNQNGLICVENLLNIFNKYDNIFDLSQELKNRNEEKTSFSKAQKFQIIPKINKSQFIHNTKQINNIESEISEIKEKLALYATNINEITNKEILELKQEKDKYLKIRLELSNSRLRIQKNLAGNKYLKSKHLKTLLDFFPNVNMEKLETIETFHDNLSKILKTELIAAEQEIGNQLDIINKELNVINERITQTLSNIDKPTYVVDRVYELSGMLQKLNTENIYYEEENQTNEILKSLKLKLNELKIKELNFIANVINDKVNKTVIIAYSEHRKAPILSLSPNNYKYEVFEDTGTGKAYSNLIIFDLSIFELTELPIIIHDSVLFKNIENDAVAKLLNVYIKSQKQSFISLDEINKYGDLACQLLQKKKVIQLSNENMLFIKDWRK